MNKNREENSAVNLRQKLPWKLYEKEKASKSYVKSMICILLSHSLKTTF